MYVKGEKCGTSYGDYNLDEQLDNVQRHCLCSRVSSVLNLVSTYSDPGAVWVLLFRRDGTENIDISDSCMSIGGNVVVFSQSDSVGGV